MKKFSRIHVFVLILIFLQIYFLKESVILGHNTFSHDNYYWLYPLFRDWVNSITTYQIPYFDFKSSTGIPFYPSIIMGKFLDPIEVIKIKILSEFNINDYLIFNINFYTTILINLFFLYKVISLNNKYILSNLLCITILLFSSIFLISFRQNGFLFCYLYSPIIFYIIILISKKFYFHLFFMLIFFISISLQAYFYSPLFLFLFFASLIHIKNYKLIFNRKYLWVLLLIIPALPSIAIFSDKDQFIFPAREPNISVVKGVETYSYSQFEPKSENLIKSDLVQNYQVLKQTGVFGYPIDFITLFSPKYNSHIIPGEFNIPGINEGYFFYGILMIFFIPVGFLYFIRHKSKVSYIFLLLLFFYFGPKYYFHQLVYMVFPPIWVFRHSTLVNLFLQSFLILFAVKGFDTLYQAATGKYSKQDFEFNAIKIYGCSILGILILAILLNASFHQFNLGLIFWGAISISLILFAAIKIRLSKSFIVSIFVLIVLLNSIELLYEFIGSKQIYSQDIQISDVKRITDEERLNALIKQPAALHSGCYYGNTWQAMRYPSLLKNERSIYAPPVARNASDIEEHCAEIDTEDKLRATDRWSSLLLYKSYYKDAISPEISLYEKRKYLIPDPLQRARAYKITQNAIYFANLQPGLLKTNLYFDKNWGAYCDGVELEIKKEKMVEIGLEKECQDLKLEYYPWLFALTLYAVIAYYCGLILLIAFMLIRFLKPYFFKKFENSGSSI